MVIEDEDQQCLGLFFLELKGRREKLLKENLMTTTHQQGTIMILLLVPDLFPFHKSTNEHG
jgi:hypothetical protein